MRRRLRIGLATVALALGIVWGTQAALADYGAARASVIWGTQAQAGVIWGTRS